MSFTSSSIFGTGGLGGLGVANQPSQSSQAPQPSSILSQGNPKSIFGNSSATQTPSHNPLFGGQPQAQQQPAQSSVFGLGQSSAGTTQPLHTSSHAAQPAFFNSLLERGKKRPPSAATQNSNFEELPNLQLGLDDIRRKARGLGTGTLKDTHPPSSKA
jgi:nuclear pore complex protein Nup93